MLRFNTLTDICDNEGTMLWGHTLITDKSFFATLTNLPIGAKAGFEHAALRLCGWQPTMLLYPAVLGITVPYPHMTAMGGARLMRHDFHRLISRR